MTAPSSGSRPSAARARSPSRTELDRPSCGVGFTTTSAGPRSAVSRLPPGGTTMTIGSTPAATAASITWQTIGLPSSSARSFARPNLVAAPAARMTAPTLIRRRSGGAGARGLVAGPGLVDERRPAAAIPLRDDLGDDREGRLGRVPAAQIQAHRSTEARELLLRDAGLAEALPPVALGLLRSHGAHVRAAAPERLDDRRFAELHVVGEDRDRVVRAEPDLVGDLVRPADDEPVDAIRREALGRGERLPAVHDHDPV